jgi:hypothetical protein
MTPVIQAYFFHWRARLLRVLSLMAVNGHGFLASIFLLGSVFFVGQVQAAVIEFNSSGGSTATNGLHFYLEDTTHIQVRRLNGTGQVYSPTAIPPSTTLDNGIFIRANGKVYGPSHTVGGGYTPSGGMYNTYAITSALPANPSTPGVQQSATGAFGITAGPQVSVLWKYTTPLDFLTAEVTLTIPVGLSVSAANPVRYYHVFDTYLGGSDNGCGVSFVDTNGNRVIGTYPPASGTTCPSSTTIPSGVSVVESFRERDGLTFSSYCASGWASFFDTSTPNCSVRQSAVMSNTVVTSYQDTGIGIELDFTAPGTYTFSYDFVVGSPNVPPYDHLEIQHDGAGTLCPESITVLACTSSTVPCPMANIVNTGTLTGSVTTSPSSPAITKTPATISLGSGAPTQQMLLQAAGAGVFTLGTSGLSTTPLNGTKCWNTATSSQSCTFIFVNTPCVSGYECLETGATYNNLVVTPAARNPLYTKLSGTDFKFDVVALQSSGAQASTYTAAANVTVELFDDVAPAATCNAYASPLASQSISFAVGDSGRKTLSANFNLPNAYRKMRCRVRDTNLSPTIYGCSSDDFAVRPSAATLVTTATAAAPSAVATPGIKAGASLTLGANTSASSSYNGALALDSSKLTAQNPSQDTTLQPGGIVGALSPASLVANAAAVNASYSEVGYLYLAPGAYRDDAWTAVDSAAGDCINSTVSDNNLSDVLVGGKYGCSIGNKTAVSLGRFYPDHFAVTSPVFSPGCGTFSYMAQPFSLTVAAQAQNLANQLTLNFAGVFAKANVVPEMENANSGVPINAARLIGLGTPVWAGGEYPFVATGFSRLGTPDGPYDELDIGLRVVSTVATDAVSLVNRNMAEDSISCTPDVSGTSNGTCTAARVATAAKMRFGRLRLQNAYGSELLALPIPLQLQYWNGSWQPNTLDSCTSLSAANFAFSFPAGTTAKPNHLAACETALTLTGTAPNYALSLSAPGSANAGWADLTLNLGSPAAGSTCTTANAGTGYTGVATLANTPLDLHWLQFNWTGAGLTNPTARATFGIYKSPLIYRRENY